VDIYFFNGAPLRGTEMRVAPQNALYRNDGGFRFTDVTDEARVGDVGYGLGVAVGDYDNDGAPDLYLNNHGPNVLYQNNGDGTFRNVTEQAGVGNGDKVGAGANFLDADGDGDLDLFVSNYLQFSYETNVSASQEGHPVYAGPRNYPPLPDVLYRNNGDGTFTDVSTASGIAAHPGWGMGTICGDYDNDGDTDIFVANDASGNFLFKNDGQGKFEEVGLFTGASYDLHGQEMGSMGVDCGDYNHDGRLDFFVTSYQNQLPTLYRNTGHGFLEDVTLLARAGTSTRPFVTWGTGFIDFNNDGNRDLLIACGHLQDNIDDFDDTTSYRTRNVLLLNTGDGKFSDVSQQSGDGLRVKYSSRGAAFDDLDNDGDVDAVILNSRQAPTILRNDSPVSNHWLQIRLRGTQSNRDGVGARVTVTAGNLRQVDEVHSGRGYQSHYGTRLYFGLGNHDRVDRIEVRWIGGPAVVWENLEADRLQTIWQQR
jgi:hypothetical protein